MAKTKVLVVDDSATMRGLIVASLRRDPTIDVVGQVGDPLEARQAIKLLNPDVITLDIEMPNMSGLEFLEKIMRLRPMPVIMISTLTKKGADETIRALEIGAIDCVEKPRPGFEHGFEDLPAKVRGAAHARVRPLTTPAAGGQEVTSKRGKIAGYSSDGRVIAIGASTGGVEALIEVLSHFPENCSPTVIAQHMPAAFTTSFAQRLNRVCSANVTEAIDGAPLNPGKVYLAPGGGAHLQVSGRAGALRCKLVPGERVNGHCPSVDTLFNSVAQECKDKAVGVILTGMGKDGAAGLHAMRSAGAATFGQNEQSCVVYGMPKVAFDIGAVQRQLSIEAIGPSVVSATSAHQRS